MSVWRFFAKRHDITFKKSLRAAEQEGALTCGGRCCRWMRERGTLFDPARLVFIDETAATKMMRVGGRCVRGERPDWPGS